MCILFTVFYYCSLPFPAEYATDEVFQFLLGKLRTSPPTGLGLTVLLRSYESTKVKALYLTAPINV